MTDREQKILRQGVAAGLLMGLAIGGMLSLLIVTKPALFSLLVR